MKKLGWAPRTSFETMLREMLEADMAAFGVAPSAHLVG
jgi:GDP-D-mannose dehydratase